MIQDKSELYLPLINHKNTHKLSNPSATCLMLHETPNKRTLRTPIFCVRTQTNFPHVSKHYSESMKTQQGTSDLKLIPSLPTSMLYSFLQPWYFRLQIWLFIFVLVVLWSISFSLMNLGIKLRTVWKCAWTGHHRRIYNFYSRCLASWEIITNKWRCFFLFLLWHWPWLLI